MNRIEKRIVFALIAFVLFLSLGVWSLWPAPQVEPTFESRLTAIQEARYASECVARGGVWNKPWCETTITIQIGK